MSERADAASMSVTAPPDISEEMQRFVLLAIPSVPYLEALLLLRAAPLQCWDAAQVARRLYLNEKTAQGLLEQLNAAGIAAVSDESQGGFCYAPQTEHMRSMIDGLADIYSRNLIGVSNLIHSTTNSKARQFADAFVFRKPPETT